ncbi:UNVERIFIED_CONTAM: DCN1-like protein 4 [Siphonaria sp. JEL0065]|nr:DCN1-like protein 4 [Siphonaria sp. JEL0065]
MPPRKAKAAAAAPSAAPSNKRTRSATKVSADSGGGVGGSEVYEQQEVHVPARATKARKTTSTSTSTLSKAKLEQKETKEDTRFNALTCSAWFEALREFDGPDAEQDELGFAAIEALCAALDVDAGCQRVLALAYKLGANQMAVFTRGEWMNGMQLLDVDSTQKLKRKLSSLDSVFGNPAEVKELYKWAFTFGKESKEVKYIGVDIAKGLWELILTNTSVYRHVNEFIKYLNDEEGGLNSVKVINKDQWMSFYDFSTSVKQDLSNYEDNSAWPVLLDEFVEYVTLSPYYSAKSPAVIPFIIQDIGADNSTIGILLAIYGIGMVLGSVFFGLICSATKLRKKWLMIAALSALAASTAFFSLGSSITALAVARILQGFASNGVWVLGLALIADFFKDNDANMGKAMSIINSGYTVGQLVGPPVGGWLFQYNRFAPFMFCGALILLDFVFRLVIMEPVTEGKPLSDVESISKAMVVIVEMKEPNPTADTLVIVEDGTFKMSNSSSSTSSIGDMEPTSVKGLLKFKQLWIVLFLNLVLSIVQHSLEPTLPLFLQHQYGMDSSQIGFVWMSMIVPLIIGGFVGGSLFDRIGLKKTFLFGFSLTCISMFVLAIPGPIHIAYTCATLAFTGFALGAAVVPISPAIPASVPARHTTLAYSAMTIVWAIGIWIGPVVGSFVYESLGWMWQLVIFGGIASITLPIILFVL